MELVYTYVSKRPNDCNIDREELFTVVNVIISLVLQSVYLKNKTKSQKLFSCLHQWYNSKHICNLNYLYIATCEILANILDVSSAQRLYACYIHVYVYCCITDEDS